MASPLGKRGAVAYCLPGQTAPGQTILFLKETLAAICFFWYNITEIKSIIEGGPARHRKMDVSGLLRPRRPVKRMIPGKGTVQNAFLNRKRKKECVFRVCQRPDKTADHDHRRPMRFRKDHPRPEAFGSPSCPRDPYR